MTYKSGKKEEVELEEENAHTCLIQIIKINI